jgi:tape measure domain-containing protein
MDTQGTIGIKATLDISEMQRNVQKYVRNINMMQDHTDVASQSVAKSFSRMQAAGAAFLSLDMAQRLTSELVSVYGTFQQLEIKFTSMLHSGEKAKKLMGELVDFSANTPFDLKGVSQSATQLVAYGTAADDVIDRLTRLGNIAAGLSQPIGDLVYLYGTSMTQGRLMTEDLNQFAGRGVPIFSELAKVMGVNKEEIKDLASEGKISFSYLEQVVENLTNKGGMFYNLMEEQSKSVTGKISNLGDTIDTIFNDLGKSNDVFINGALDGANYLAEHYKEVGSALGVLISLYGVHKTALIAHAAAYKAAGTAERAAMIKAEAEALKGLETEELKAKLTKQGLKVGSDDYVAALKSEIVAEKERQTQIATTANAELAVAKDRLVLAEQTKAQALQNVQQKKEELAAVISQAQAEKTASLEKKMSLESEKQSRVALRVVKLQEEKDSAIAEARHLKEISASEEKISAKNREIAKISEKIAAAKAEEIQHSRNIVALRSEMKAVNNGISSKAVDKAQTALNTAEQKLNSAEISRNTAVREVNSKQMVINTATKKAGTLQTGLETASISANTAAKSLGAKATALLTIATSKLNAVIAANAWTIALAGTVALGYGVYKLITYQTEAEKWQGKLNDRFREFNSEVSTEQTEIDRLFGKLDAATRGTKEYDDAKKSILDKYGEYLRGLGDEIEQLTNVEAAYKAVSVAARQSAIDRAVADAKGVASDTYKENSTKHLEQLEKAIRSKIKNERDASALYSTIVHDIQKNGALSDVADNIVRSFSKNVYKRGVDGVERLSKVDNPIRDAVEALKKDNELLNSAFSDIDQKFGKASVDYLSMTSEQIKKVIADYESEIKAGRETVQITIDLSKAREALIEVEKQENKKAETVAERKVRWAKELADAEAKLNKLKADNSIATQKEIEEQQKVVDKLKKNLEIDDKSVNSKEKKQEAANRLRVESAERLQQLNEQLQQEKEAAVQAELDIAQAKIDAMNEGHLKQQAQIELNFRKAKVENDRRTSEYIKSQQQIERLAWEKEHPDYKNKGLVFEPKTKTKADLSKDKQDALVAYENAAAEARKKAEEALFKSLTGEYQSYTDQRLAIEKKFNQDLAALQAERSKYQKNGDTDKVAQIDRSIAQATKDKGKSLMGLDFEQLKQTPEYVRAFENLKNTSSETLSSLLSQLENAKQTAAKVLNPEDLREYTSTIQSIMDELDSRNPFKALLDRKKELKEVGEELKRAKEQLDYVQAGGKIVTGIRSTNFNKDTGAIEVENEYMSVAKAIEIYRKAQDKAAKSSNDFQKAEEEVADVVDQLFSSIKDVGDTIGGTSGEVLSFIGDIGLFVTSSINAWETAANAGSKAVQAVEKASVILGVISGVIQLMDKLSSLTKSAYEQYEVYAEKVKEVNALKDAVNDYAIAVLEAKQAEDDWFSGENLNSLRNYRKLHEQVSEAYYEKLAEEQAVYQNQKGGGWLTGALNGIMNVLSPLGWTGVWQKWTGQNYKEGTTAAINNLRIETRKKSKGFLGTGIGAKSQKTEDLISWVKNNLGADLFDDKGLIDKELAQSIIDNYGDKLVGQTKETLEALIELREKYDEYMEQLHDYVSSLYAPLVGNFVDSLWDWLDSGKDALDSFKEYASDTFRDIVTDMMKTIVLDKVIGNFDDDIAALYEKYASGDISETDLMKMVAERTGELVDNYEKNIPVLENILSSVNRYFKDVGIDLKKQQDDSTRSAVEKGIQGVSQDSISEMNGRLTTTTMFLSDILKAVQLQTESTNNVSLAISDLKAMSVQVNENLRIIKDNVIVMIGHLSNIDANTSKLIDIQKDMNSVRKAVERMNDKGVKMV